MQDAFTRKPTRIRGRSLPDAQGRAALQHDHQRRLEALDRVGAAAAQCGLRSDSDRDLFLLAEDEVSLLEGAGGDWAQLGAAIRAWRDVLPLCRLEDFGFNGAAENPLEETNPHLRRIGGGVEAWAFVADDGSVYKFFRPLEGHRIGSVFDFEPGEETALRAVAHLGSYRGVLEKLMLIELLDGMPSEVVAVTPEGIVVAKQALGEPLPQGDDVSGVLPDGLIVIPSRFLRANRDHPRLLFVDGRPWLVGDLHARNFVRAKDGALRVIDLVAAPWPRETLARNPLIGDWIARVREDPRAGLLRASPDDEL